MDHKVLVIGLGISGIACVKALNALGKKVCVFDEQDDKKLKEKLEELKNIDAEYFLGSDSLEKIDTDKIEYAIKSPGIKYETPIVDKLLKNNIKIITDIEAAYEITSKLTQAKIISITGTNGKTTTTTLIGEILKEANKSYKLTGNIGFGIMEDALNSNTDQILVAEVSSFQLAGTINYKPNVSVLTNITPDHMDFHHSLENYIEAKFNNSKNQDENDYSVLNYDDETVRSLSNNIKAKKIFFSSSKILDEGIFEEDNKVYYKKGNNKQYIIDSNDIFIPGKHNIENAMAAMGATLALGVEPSVINKVLKDFKGVEHRLEFSGEHSGVKFYNDSKGTNPDASIKAIQGIKKPIILIAGGYDKGSLYDDFILTFEDKVKALVLLGQTADDIEKCARKHGFINIYRVSNMDEAVKKCFELSVEGDNVVLSPACASWGMYPNYEVRGRDFKERVDYYGKISSSKKI